MNVLGGVGDYQVLERGARLVRVSDDFRHRVDEVVDLVLVLVLLAGVDQEADALELLDFLFRDRVRRDEELGEPLQEPLVVEHLAEQVDLLRRQVDDRRPVLQRALRALEEVL